MFKQNIRLQLLELFPADQMARWFDPLDISLNQEGAVVQVLFPHIFFRHWFMSHAKSAFEKAACSLCRNAKIIYSLGFEGLGRDPVSNPEKVRELPQKIPEKKGTQPLRRDNKNLLLEHYTFDNFLFNRKNDFPLAAAHDAVEKIAAGDFPPYTPFVVYGQSGSGKSHLLRAMAGALTNKGKRVFYGDPENYRETLILGPDRYSPPGEDGILLDDAQRSASSAQMQNFLARLVDACLTTGRLLVIAFDLNPALCGDLGQKLVSRLTAGLTVEIKRPDLEIRLNYAEKHNKLLNLGLKSEQLLQLARRTQDICSIDGYLARLTAYRSMVGKQGQNALNYDASSIMFTKAERSKLTPAAIVNNVAEHFSVSPEDIIGKKRDKKISLPRHIAIFLCRDMLGLSLVQIGNFFSERDHTSILYSVNKMAKLLDSDKDMHKVANDIGKLCLNAD
ncbi:MAG: hypothetical protein LBN33_01640 [Desulfovibrio sp.]|nr:hypothetical protein [Desulfovibrio sp.]